MEITNILLWQWLKSGKVNRFRIPRDSVSGLCQGGNLPGPVTLFFLEGLKALQKKQHMGSGDDIPSGVQGQSPCRYTPER
jgi:hypothetical protein